MRAPVLARMALRWSPAVSSDTTSAQRFRECRGPRKAARGPRIPGASIGGRSVQRHLVVRPARSPAACQHHRSRWRESHQQAVPVRAGLARHRDATGRAAPRPRCGCDQRVHCLLLAADLRRDRPPAPHRPQCKDRSARDWADQRRQTRTHNQPPFSRQLNRHFAHVALRRRSAHGCTPNHSLFKITNSSGEVNIWICHSSRTTSSLLAESEPLCCLLFLVA